MRANALYNNISIDFRQEISFQVGGFMTRGFQYRCEFDPEGNGSRPPDHELPGPYLNAAICMTQKFEALSVAEPL
jgi:hypothetical protein